MPRQPVFQSGRQAGFPLVSDRRVHPVRGLVEVESDLGDGLAKGVRKRLRVTETRSVVIGAG